MKKSVLLLSLSLISLSGIAQNVNIPDANFKAYLLSESAINTNGDSEIQVSEATAYAGHIYAGNLNIADLTGIEAFTSITLLQCHGNQLTSLDLSSNLGLTGLLCDDNQISTINLGNNTLMSFLSCVNNQLTTLDVSSNLGLSTIYADGNNLTNLNLGPNIALQTLWLNFNQLSSINVSQNTALTSLQASFNQLTNINLSNNLALQSFGVLNNPIQSINLVANVNLIEFSCQNSALTELNIKNGNNANIITFNILANPDLYCVQVDNPSYSNTNWNNVDAQIVFLEDCAFLDISEAHLEEVVINVFPNPAQDIVTFSDLAIGAELLILDITGKVMFSSIVSANQLTINTEDFTNGLYLIHLNHSGTISTKKLIINK